MQSLSLMPEEGMSADFQLPGFDPSNQDFKI
jgi:hypothetical protein